MPVPWLLLAAAASLSGIVVDAGNGNPIEGAKVSLRFGNKTALTSAAGRFEFLDLKPDTYSIEVQKEGFATQTSPQTPTFRLADGEAVNNITIRLLPEARISGRVLNSAGKPVRSSCG